jgi:hypothetical protein
MSLYRLLLLPLENQLTGGNRPIVDLPHRDYAAPAEQHLGRISFCRPIPAHLNTSVSIALHTYPMSSTRMIITLGFDAALLTDRDNNEIEIVMNR